MTEKISESKTFDKKQDTSINAIDSSQQQKDLRLWRWLKDVFLVESRVEKLERELRIEIDEQTDLDDEQKRFLRMRWLEQVLWWENKAISFRNKYNLLRMLMIIGGAAVTALVSLLSTELSSNAKVIVQMSSIVLSLLVTISAALEGVFQFGERRRHKRKAVELLKSEGWQFFQLSGRYYHFRSLEKGRDEAYAEFADRVEDMAQKEIEEYVSILNESKEKKEEHQ